MMAGEKIVRCQHRDKKSGEFCDKLLQVKTTVKRSDVFCKRHSAAKLGSKIKRQYYRPKQNKAPPKIIYLPYSTITL